MCAKLTIIFTKKGEVKITKDELHRAADDVSTNKWCFKKQ